MFDSPTAQPFATDTDRRDRPAFLVSHRAHSACAHEIGHLAKEVAGGLAALHAAGAIAKPEVRQSPDRCIVQLGPVALTIAWLRSALGTVADGELLVIVWRGAVAPKPRQLPERARARPAAVTATALWEEVLSVAAEDPQSWRWRPAAGGADCTSAALARHCVERLHQAYTEHRAGESPAA
jgi:hypothetical protein